MRECGEGERAERGGEDALKIGNHNFSGSNRTANSADSTVIPITAP